MNPCKLYLPKTTPPLYNEEEDPRKTHLTLDGSEGRGSPSTYRQEAVAEEAVTEEAAVEEEAVVEEAIQETRMTEDQDQS